MKAVKTSIEQLSVTFTVAEVTILKALFTPPIPGETPQQAILRQDLVLALATLLV